MSKLYLSKSIKVNEHADDNSRDAADENAERLHFFVLITPGFHDSLIKIIEVSKWT